MHSSIKYSILRYGWKDRIEFIFGSQDSNSSVSPNNSFFSPLRIWVGTWAIYFWLCPVTWILGRFLTLTLHSASHSRQHHHCPSPTRKSSCTSRHFCGMWLSGRPWSLKITALENMGLEKKIPTSSLCHLFHYQNQGWLSFNDSYIQGRNISFCSFQPLHT